MTKTQTLQKIYLFHLYLKEEGEEAEEEEEEARYPAKFFQRFFQEKFNLRGYTEIGMKKCMPRKYN